MKLTVIVGGVVRTLYLHRHIYRVDCLVAVRDVERHRREVRVGVREVAFLKSHIRDTGVGSLRSRITAVHEVVDIIQIIVCRGRVASHRVKLAVIVGGVVRTYNLHRHSGTINFNRDRFRNIATAVCTCEDKSVSAGSRSSADGHLIHNRIGYHGETLRNESSVWTCKCTVRAANHNIGDGLTVGDVLSIVCDGNRWIG